MTRQEVIEHLCETVNMAHRAIGDFSHASDCFCKPKESFEHQGFTLEYVRKAVINQLKLDGYTDRPGFDNPNTHVDILREEPK